MVIRVLTAVAGALAAGGLAAQEPKAEPSPAATFAFAAQSIIRGGGAANVVPAPFRAQVVVDNRFAPKINPPKDDSERDPRDRTGKMHCLVCEHGLAPMVAVFVREDPARLKADDGLSALLRRLDQENDDPALKAVRPRKGLLADRQSDKLAAFVSFLRLEGGSKAATIKGDDGSDQKIAIDLEYPHDEARAVKAAAVRKYFDLVKCDRVPFTLAPDKSASVAAFGVDDTTAVTVVIYNRLRVAQRWELKLADLTDEKVNEILTATDAMIRGRKP